MKNKNYLLVLIFLTSASVSWAGSFRNAMAANSVSGQICTYNNTYGVCRDYVFDNYSDFSCGSSEVNRGHAGCSNGKVCCVPKNAGVKEMPEAGKPCTADGVPGVCKVPTTYSSGGYASGVISIPPKCADNEVQANAKKVSGCLTSEGEICCVSKDKVDKCCVISLDPKDFKNTNCKKDTTNCQGTIKNVNCDNLKECNFFGSKANDGTGAGIGGAGGPASTTQFDNPIGFKDVSQLISSVLSKLMGLIAIVAIVFIVIGGIMYIVSAGDTNMVTKAKNICTGAVIGLAIALAAPTFLKEIQSILGGGETGGSAETWVVNAPTIKQIAMNVLKLLLSVVGILGIIALVVAGGMLLTAYGSEKQIDKGKEIMKYAIIGIALSISALIIVREVASLLGVPAG